MATTKLHGNDVHTVGELPQVGSEAPTFALTGADGSPVTLEQYEDSRVVLNIFPNIATGVCQQSVRTFNERAAGLENAVVLCVSADQPADLAGFCAAEGLQNVVTASAAGTTFGEDYGMGVTEGPLAGRLARSVVVVNDKGEVVHTQLVPDTGQEPDYDKALSALD